jgi:hypothetical protein
MAGGVPRDAKMIGRLRNRLAARAGMTRHPVSHAMLRQRTLKESIRTTGVGLHTGARVELTLRRSPPSSI